MNLDLIFTLNQGNSYEICPPNLKYINILKHAYRHYEVASKFLTSRCGGFSPLNKDIAAPVNAIAKMAPPRPIPAHKSHPFCRLKGSLKSATPLLQQ